MDNLISKWAHWLVRYRGASLAIATLLTVFLGYFALHLSFDFSPESIFLRGDPAHSFYVDQFKTQYGERANVCIVAIDGDIKDKTIQHALWDLHNTIKQNKTLTDVRSLANTSVFIQKDGALVVEPIFSPSGEANEENLEWALHDPAIGGLLVAKDGSASAVIINLPLLLQNQVAKEKIAGELTAAVNEVRQKYPQNKFYLTGTAMTEAETISTLKRDQLMFVPIVALLMGLVLWFSFRNWRGVVLPFLVTGVTTVWAIGFIVLCGHNLNVVNNKLIVLLMVIGISDALHMFARYEDELTAALRRNHEGGSQVEHFDVIERMTRGMAVSCLLTTTATAMGFAASLITNVDLVRQFAFDAAMGVMFSYVVSMLLIPSILAYLPMPKHIVWPPKSRFAFLSLDKYLTKIAQISTHHAKTVIWVALSLTAVAGWFAKDIRPNQRFISELPANAPSVQALTYVEKKLTGIIPFDVVFEGSPARLKEPQIIRATADIAEFIRTQSVKPNAVSFADTLLSFDRSLTGQASTSPVSQWSDEKIAQAMLLFETSDPQMIKMAQQDFFSENQRFVRVQGLSPDAKVQDLVQLRTALEQKIAAMPLDGVQLHLTGPAMITARALESIILNTLASLGVAILAIFIMCLAVFRSLKLGFIAIFPNLLPIVFTFAAMVLFGISMRVASGLIFSMALGIAVDACIHLLTRLKQEASHDLAIEGILERTLRGTGRPVIYGTVLLLVGFSVFGLSKFQALKDLAMLSAIMLSTALVVDLFLFPAMVVLIKPSLKK